MSAERDAQERAKAKAQERKRNMSVFDKIRHAATTGRPVELTAGEAELLMSLFANEFAKAETDLETWKARLADYERAKEREAGEP